MSKEDKAPIIIKKKGGHGEHGHHGGAWKIAYADFVTAMMAFFLLMWLLNATSEEQKRGIADYFSPVSVFEVKGYSGGSMGSQAASVQGAFDGRGPPEQNLTPTPGSIGPEERIEPGKESIIIAETIDENNDGIADSLKGEEAEDAEEPKEHEEKTEVEKVKELEEKALEEALKEKEEKLFQEAAKELEKAIAETPDLKGLLDNLMIEQTDEGLRVQLFDQDGEAMFPLGSADMYEPAKKLLEQIAKVIIKLNKEIMISGHTDAKPYATAFGYSNWELSSDRANASRRILVNYGVDEVLLNRVQGRADKELLDPKNPTNPKNRRITITILKDKYISQEKE